ncbi:MAG: hypothetical protein WAM66_15245 [Acidobacteriaceae bacterium]
MNSNSDPIYKDNQTPNAGNESDKQAKQTNPDTPIRSSVPSAPPAKSHYEITCKTEKTKWDKFKDWVGILGILLLAVYTAFTIRMYYANNKSANAAYSAADTARCALVDGQRAFVYFSPNPWLSPNISVKNNQLTEWAIRVPVSNSGATPTRKMEDRISRGLFPGGIPEGFKFPDLGDVPRIPVMLGPKQEILSGRVTISPDEAKLVWEQKEHLYIWGWAIYGDVFDRVVHRTNFCYEVSFRNDPTSVAKIEKGQIGAFASMCDRHNCADKDCDGQ